MARPPVIEAVGSCLSDGGKGEQRLQLGRVVKVERGDAADPAAGRVLVQDGLLPGRGDEVGARSRSKWRRLLTAGQLLPDRSTSSMAASER